jgi:8-oxo-dGTP pyrophosphatase MutT (NUDIX family)
MTFVALVGAGADESRVNSGRSFGGNDRPLKLRPRPPISLSDFSFKGAAGCCFYSSVGGRVCVLLGKERTGEWCFAMGKREKGESLVDTALRETEEEMHIRVRKKALTTAPWCLYTQRDGDILKNVILIYFVPVTEPLSLEALATMSKSKDRALTMSDYMWMPLDKIVDSSAYIDHKIRRCAKTIFGIAKKRGILDMLP